MCRLHRLVTPSYFSVYTVLASSSAVTYLSSKTLIFHNFQRPTIKFLDFPGQEIEILKFHDFPGFPWPVQTLLINSSAGLSSKTSSVIFNRRWFLPLTSSFSYLKPKGANFNCTLQKLSFWEYFIMIYSFHFWPAQVHVASKSSDELGTWKRNQVYLHVIFLLFVCFCFRLTCSL